MALPMINTIPLDEIAPNACVRFTTVDGKCYLSIRDIIMVVSKKDNKRASQTWRDMVSDKKMLVCKLEVTMYQFPGKGQSKTPVITLEGAIELIMCLPGSTANFFRTSMAKIISRYITGDLTLCQEVKENKEAGVSNSCSKFMQITSGDTKRKLDEMIEGLPETSYIYATYSPIFPGLVKIGRSRNVKTRLSSGNTFIAPAPHVLIAMSQTLDAVRDEAEAHAYFDKFRREGEFFEISHEDAEKYLDSVIKPRHDQELKEFYTGAKGALVYV